MANMDFKILEITKENEKEYLDPIYDLSELVFQNMEAKGQSGQLFLTDKEDISEYIHSAKSSVFAAVDNNNKVIATTYITEEQTPFRYNDLTKYFRYGKQYQEYVKKQYPSQQSYLNSMLLSYEQKTRAFAYAKSKIANDYPQYGGDIIKFLNHELEEEGNHFHEKSMLRELVNKYMLEYIHMQEKKTHGSEQNYERFYWITSKEISGEYEKEVKPKSEEAREWEQLIDGEYEQILSKSRLKIYEQPTFDPSKYFTANTSNSVEIDTYVTDPNDRRAGLARILVFESLKKHMCTYFENKQNTEMFVCSTLHRDNLSSKYVSEFFGLKDSLFVGRRYGRDREVHICRVERKEYEEYLLHIQKKLAVLYDYNPENIVITPSEHAQILTEQLEYEMAERNRLTSCTGCSGKTYNGNIDYKKSKNEKVKRLLTELENQVNSQLNDLKKQIDSHINSQDERDR